VDKVQETSPGSHFGKLAKFSKVRGEQGFCEESYLKYGDDQKV